MIENTPCAVAVFVAGASHSMSSRAVDASSTLRSTAVSSDVGARSTGSVRSGAVADLADGESVAI